jgi:hypothetical protein
MINSTLGAPLGGTTVGGHHGFEVVAFSVIVPPNLGSGAGIWLPGIVVVAPGEPSVPVMVCAVRGPTVTMHAAATQAAKSLEWDLIVASPSGSTRRRTRQRAVASTGLPSAGARLALGESNVAARNERELPNSANAPARTRF